MQDKTLGIESSKKKKKSTNKFVNFHTMRFNRCDWRQSEIMLIEKKWKIFR